MHNFMSPYTIWNIHIMCRFQTYLYIHTYTFENIFKVIKFSAMYRTGEHIYRNINAKNLTLLYNWARKQVDNITVSLTVLAVLNHWLIYRPFSLMNQWFQPNKWYVSLMNTLSSVFNKQKTRKYGVFHMIRRFRFSIRKAVVFSVHAHTTSDSRFTALRRRSWNKTLMLWTLQENGQF